MSCQQGQIQAMVDQRPVYDRKFKRREGRRSNQVIGRAGIIRPDKRKKVKFL